MATLGSRVVVLLGRWRSTSRSRRRWLVHVQSLLAAELLELGDGLAVALCRERLLEDLNEDDKQNNGNLFIDKPKCHRDGMEQAQICDNRRSLVEECEARGQMRRPGADGATFAASNGGPTCQVGDRVTARFLPEPGGPFYNGSIADVRPERGLVWLDWDDLGVRGREVSIEHVFPRDGTGGPACAAVISHALVMASLPYHGNQHQVLICAPSVCTARVTEHSAAGGSSEADDFLRWRRGGTGEVFLKRFAWGRMLDPDLRPDGPVPDRIPAGLVLVRLRATA